MAKIEKLAQRGVIIFYDDSFTPLTGCFGNFHICENPIEFEGHSYSNSEAAFQAQKFANNKDLQATFKKFNRNTTGKEALALGKTRLSQEQVAKWDRSKFDVMYDILQAKFDCNEALQKKLLATGDALLVEHLPDPHRSDTFWSDGFYGPGGEHGTETEKGGNNLGMCLMWVRHGYQEKMQGTKTLFDQARYEAQYRKLDFQNLSDLRA